MRFYSSGSGAESSLRLGFLILSWVKGAPSPPAFHLPPLKAELLSPRSISTISFHLASPYILLSQTSSITSEFSSPAHTCKQSISSCKSTPMHTNTHPPPLDISIISPGTGLSAVSRKGQMGKYVARGRKRAGEQNGSISRRNTL